MFTMMMMTKSMLICESQFG